MSERYTYCLCDEDLALRNISRAVVFLQGILKAMRIGMIEVIKVNHVSNQRDNFPDGTALLLLNWEVLVNYSQGRFSLF